LGGLLLFLLLLLLFLVLLFFEEKNVKNDLDHCSNLNPVDQKRSHPTIKSDYKLLIQKGFTNKGFTSKEFMISKGEQNGTIH